MKRSSLTQLRKLLILAAVMILLTASLSGCWNKDSKEGNGENASTPTTEAADPTDPEPTETTPVPAETDPVQETITGTVTAEKLDVRSNPGIDSTIVKQLTAQTQVEILEQKTVGSNVWGRIEDGWINLSGVQLNSTDTPDATDPSDSTEPTDAPSGSNETTGTMGTVTASALYIRSGPGTKYDTAGKLKSGDRVEILETSGNWGRIEKGWVSLKYVKLDSSTTSTTTPDTSTSTPDTSTSTTASYGVITASELNVRSAAGKGNKSVDTYKLGTRVKVTEQTTVDGTTWGKTSDGWISLKYVYIEGTTGSDAGSGTVTADSLNIRSGPGKDFTSVGKLNTGDKVEILTQLEIGKLTWGYTKSGWICMDYVKMG